MIDNSHFIYGGVILVFAIGGADIAVAGLLFLVAGLAVATTVRIRKRRKRLKASHFDPADKEDVFPSEILVVARHVSRNDGTDGLASPREPAN